MRIGNLPRQSLELNMADTQYVQLAENAEGTRTVLKQDDLLFSITAYLGSVAVVDSTSVGAYVSQHVALCRLDQTRFFPRFVGYFMLGESGQRQLNQSAYGGTKLQLALADIQNLSMSLPPLDEQRAIASYLDDRTAKTDALVAEAEALVDLLKERRSALISAAVTRQIDVGEEALARG